MSALPSAHHHPFKDSGDTMTRSIPLAVIPGDGIGREVTPEALKVLRAATASDDVTFDLHTFELGIDRYLATGEMLPDAELEQIARTEAILFGAVGGVPGDPRLAGVSIERALLLRLRFAFDQYVNLRPAHILPGGPSVLSVKDEVDLVIVREGTEGAYSGNGGVLRAGTEHMIATEVSINTRHGVERVVRYAFELARTRRRHVTVVHKNNVLVHSGGLWQAVQEEISAEFPDVEVDYLHVDAATIHLVTAPERFDVIVTDNLFGDILTDLAGAIAGGIGLAASGNIDPERRHPSMFEPVHGSAPDIAGTGIADPTAAVLSAGMMLEHLGLDGAAARVREAVAADLASRTPGSSRTTVEIGDAIAARLG